MDEEELEREVRRVLRASVEELSDRKRLRKRRSRRHRRLELFRKRLRSHWAESLDFFEEIIASCAELGDVVLEDYGSNTNQCFALDLIRSRTIQVGWEVYELASAGYADGAYARWRTMHELAAVAEFLRVFGERTATKYLAHAQIKNRKNLREYEENSDALGYEPVTKVEVQFAEETKRQLTNKYGKEFGRDWGWAAEECGIKKPTFFDIRRKAGYGHWKAHFGMANHAVHAGPHGVLFRLSHHPNQKTSPSSRPIVHWP
jgi:hypothetical protein